MRALLGGGGLGGALGGGLGRVWGLAGLGCWRWVWWGRLRRFGGRLLGRFGLGLLDGVTPALKLDPTAGAFFFFGAHDETTHFQVGITAFSGSSLTPGFPPFVNSIPLLSSASRILATVDGLVIVLLFSKLKTDIRETPAARARSSCVSFSSSRAAAT